MTDMAKKEATIVAEQIPVAQIKPNSYNPNRMADDEFAELVAEVQHLGRLPKPVVVRKNCDIYEIVGGEHGWRAAQQSGSITDQHVWCEEGHSWPMRHRFSNGTTVNEVVRLADSPNGNSYGELWRK